MPDEFPIAAERDLNRHTFESALGEDFAAFVRENSNAGIRIHVPAGYESDTPVVARYALGENADAAIDDNIIVAEAGSRVTVVIIADSADASRCFRGGRTRILAENCAVVRLVQIQTMNASSAHLSDVSAVVWNGARVEVTQIELGAESAYAGCRLKLLGNQSAAAADTFYFGDGDRKLDFNYIARHVGYGSRSELNAGGALFGASDKIYRGTLDFAPGAVQAKGRETENTLLFSDKARGRSAPLILCGEEDVEGSHAATIGKLDGNKLYYMQSRGLSEAEAKRLMVLAQLETVLKKTPIEVERDRLRAYLSERI
ncbi:MAG: SufD family Fe-S cluster assembly protein [Oscillospiraceae bacterium]|jgi:Fe-S cluster assembly scaffold protein SufB|nr:SufD family Fe-S cluster assembly protein [Oscillospiraceae bacterium]